MFLLMVVMPLCTLHGAFFLLFAYISYARSGYQTMAQILCAVCVVLGAVCFLSETRTRVSAARHHNSLLPLVVPTGQFKLFVLKLELSNITRTLEHYTRESTPKKLD